MWNSKLADPRRADGRARGRADAPGPGPRPPAGRAGSRRRDHLPQPPRRLRGAPTGSRCCASGSGWRCSTEPRPTSRRSCTPITAGELDHVPGMVDAEGRRRMTENPMRAWSRAQKSPSRRRSPGRSGGTRRRGRVRSRATSRRWWQKVRAGELGSLPIVVGLVVIVVVFGSLDDTFLTERNFTNLLLQMARGRDDRDRHRVRPADRRDRPVGRAS